MEDAPDIKDDQFYPVKNPNPVGDRPRSLPGFVVRRMLDCYYMDLIKRKLSNG
jgi:hypothetical protein